jgi:hypothetical protein
MEREVWFEKWLWSYMPCHWKGVAAMIAVIAPTPGAIFIAQYAFGENADWLQIPIFLAGLLTMLVICKRHSK